VEDCYFSVVGSDVVVVKVLVVCWW